MSIIDQDKGHLNTKLWKNDVLIKDVSKLILDPLYNVLESNGVTKDQIAGVYLVGSNASTRYRPDSDLDVSVLLYTDNLDIEPIIEKTTEINGKKIPNTEHEIYYYVLDSNYILNMPNVYDIVNNKWLRNEQYPVIDILAYKQYVKSKLLDVNNLIFELDADIIDYKDLIYDINDKAQYKALIKKKIAAIENDMKEIAAEYAQLKLDRKYNFSDSNKSNIVYKYLEKYKLLQKMQKVYKLLHDGFQIKDINDYEKKETIREKLTRLKKHLFEDINIIQNAIAKVRKVYPNIPDNHYCVEASKMLLPTIQQYYPDAKLDQREVVKPNGETLATHIFIVSDKAGLVFDSQMAQFQDALNLSQEFVDKGVYTKIEFDELIKDYYMSLNNL